MQVKRKSKVNVSKAESILDRLYLTLQDLDEEIEYQQFIDNSTNLNVDQLTA